MKNCPVCNSTNISVPESRAREKLKLPSFTLTVPVRRRRLICEDCGHRWRSVELNYETLDEILLIVRDGGAPKPE